MWASLGIVALLFVLGLLRGMPFLELFMTAVTLAMAAVPEGLLTVVTIALALGVVRMSRRCAMVRKLPAYTSLGATWRFGQLVVKKWITTPTNVSPLVST